MNLHQAMVTLGFNPTEHFRHMLSLSRSEQIQAARDFYETAKSRAKSLMIKHHPDRGGSQEKFVIVSNCIDIIEAETKDFIDKISMKMAEEKERRSNQVLISIG